MKDHFSTILEYAKVYEAMEILQRREGALLPIGDQKTGVIAEFYARLFAAEKFPSAELIYGTPSEHAWDITVRRVGQPDHKIQVKAVSAHSTTSRVSPIHPGWHELYLMRLDKKLWPEGFWILSAKQATWSAQKLGASTMPRSSGSGSVAFKGAEDNLPLLLSVLNAARG
ncbi:MAG: hypothetical protein B7Z03_07415 [Hydrogenophilales bacterium 32-62-9]|nr:MAG: hypothetical protein B7Z03_07415 [Hydrogenophilales bacterium 32-62-9]